MAPTLGQRLRYAREQRGLKIEDIAHSTRIPARRLRELEADDLTGCGGLTYAKSFLGSYAKEVGIDASEVLTQIQTPPLGGARDYHYLVQNHGQWVDDSRFPAMMPPKRTVSTPRTLGFVAVSVIVCLSIFGVSLWHASARGSWFSGLTKTVQPADPFEVRSVEIDGSGLSQAPVTAKTDEAADLGIIRRAEPTSPPPKAIPVE